MLLFTDYTSFDKGIIFKLGEIQKELEIHFSKFPEPSIHWFGEKQITTGFLERSRDSVFLEKYSTQRLDAIKQWLELKEQESIPDIDTLRENPSILLSIFERLNKSEYKISEEVLNIQGLDFNQWDLLYLKDLWNWRLLFKIDIEKKSNFKVLYERLVHPKSKIEEEFRELFEVELGKASIVLSAYSYFEKSENILFEEYFSLFFKTHSKKFYSLNKTLEVFIQDFLTIPSEFLDTRRKQKSGIFSWLDNFFPTSIEDSEKGVAADYEGFSQPIIINGQSFISYHFGMNYLFDLSSRRFRDTFNIEDLPQYFLSEDSNHPQIWANEFFNLIHIKIEMAHVHFDLAFKKLKSLIPNKTLFKNDIQLLEYLIKAYKDIKKHDNYKLVIFKRLKLSRKLSGLIMDCYLGLFEKKLAEIKGDLANHLLAPSELEYVFDSIKNIRPKADLSNSIHIKGFVKEKISIPDRHQKELEENFALLFRLSNKKGEPFMEQEDVEYILASNFSCYPGAFAPKVFKFNGHKNNLRYFLFQIYEWSSSFGISKNRITQFALQNFEPYFNENLNQKHVDSLFSNLRGTKPTKRPFISLEMAKKL